MGEDILNGAKGGKSYTPSKLMPEGLYKFQEDAVRFLARTKGRAIIADEMGLGKTIEALAYLKILGGRALVVCPANVLYKWQAESEKWVGENTSVVIPTGKTELPDDKLIHIMTYGILASKLEALMEIPYDLIICDECFPKGTPISTPKGDVPIETLKAGDTVTGIDSLGNVCYNKVHKVNSREAQSFVTINGMRLTPNHPVYVEGLGYVEAKEIKRGMRIVRKAVYTGQKGETVLLYKLFGTMEGKDNPASQYHRPRFSGEGKQGSKENTSGETGTGKEILSTHEGKQPYERPEGKGKDDGKHERLLGERSITVPLRGERGIHQTTITCPRLFRVGDGSTDKDSPNRQLGLCNTGFIGEPINAGSRVRWEVSPEPKATNNRPAQGTSIVTGRVFSCTDTEQTCKLEYLEMVEVTSVSYENGKTPEMVYNFETDTGNYFAHGFLVHNCHYLKNPKAQRTRAVKNLIKSGIPRMIFLSGTPFMNKPLELFTLVNMLNPVQFSSYYNFAKRYCGAIVEGGAWYFPKNTVTNADELAERLKGVMIRRTKNNVGIQLPPLTRVSIPMSLSNKGKYNSTRRDFKTWYKHNKGSATALTRLTALRQVVGMGKIDDAIELADSILESNQKVVLFCHHKAVVKELQEKLSKKYKVGAITGETSPKVRQKLAEEFLENSNVILRYKEELCVMIITTAGIEGIDLYSANHIIFVEREWVPAQEEQAEARLHRIGQERNVTAHYLVARDTVDEKLDTFVKEKREMVKQVIRQDEILEIILENI